MLDSLKRFFGSTPSPNIPAANARSVVTTIRPPAIIQSIVEPTPIPQRGPHHAGSPVPYYPRKGPAVPAVSPEKLIATQSELIRELRQASALSFDEFDQFIRPAIARYATFVHLLPASEYDHHSDLGGLFRHGLEVALNASRRAEGKEFALNEDPCIRKFQIFRWRACALLGGMLHDLGKAVIDVGAIDDTGNIIWNPHIQPLWEWIVEQRLDHYSISWRQGRRHREHDAISATAVSRIIPDETMRWMGQYRGRMAYDAMLMALTGSSDRNNPLVELIKQADIDSVQTDRASSQKRMASIGEAGSRGNAALLIRAMRERLLQNEWGVNQPGSPLWHTTDGLHAIFPHCALEAINHLRAAGNTSIPNDPQIVMEILRDCGIISPVMLPNGTTYHVQRIKIFVKDRAGNSAEIDTKTIKFVNEHIIPDYYVMPPPVEVELLEPDGKPRNGGGSIQPYNAEASTPAAKINSESVVKNESSESAAPAVVVPTVTKTKNKTATKASSKTSTADGAIQPSVNTHTSHHEGVFLSSDDDEDEVDHLPVVSDASTVVAADPVTTADPATTPLRDRANEADARDQLIIDHQQLDRDPFPPTSVQGAKSWLEKQSNGIYLTHVIERAHAGELKWEQHIFERDESLHVIFPMAFEGCGNEPSVLRDTFEHDHWIERDPTRPQRATVDLTVGKQQVICIRFTRGVGLALKLLLPSPISKEKEDEIGPYIRGEMARRFIGNISSMENDGPIIRMCFYTLLQERFSDPGADWTNPAKGIISTYALEFARRHKIEFSMVRRLLKQGNNYLLLPTPELNFDPNPGYSLEIDQALFNNSIEPASQEAAP